jgi:hypothetical protein
MAPGSRRRLAPRRRRDDEDESSLVGDVEDDSLSDGSALSLGDEDVEHSDASEEPDGPADGSRKPPASKQAATEKRSRTPPETSTSVEPNGSAAAITSAANGLKTKDAAENESEVQFDETTPEDNVDSLHTTKAPDEAPKAPRRETLAQRARREHQEYLKQRDSDPAFVPNRGGFFLHDDRSPNVQNFSQKPFARGRGRGFNGMAPIGYVITNPHLIHG